MKSVKTILKNASRTAAVRIYRDDLEDGWNDGYVVGTGPKFFALHIVDNGVRLDGFSCLRYSDVTEANVPDLQAAFIARTLELRGLRVADECPVDLSSIAALIRSAGRAYPVVALHFEETKPDECYIGKVVSVNKKEVSLLLVMPGGEWATETDTHDLSEITRVDFVGGYEEALVLVAGEG